jgi:Tol biopolymer transport system component
VWLRALDALDATPVPNTLNAQSVKWSTDARALLVSAVTAARASTIVSLSGGGTTLIPEGFDGELGASGSVYVDWNTRILRRNPQGTVDTLVRLQPGTTVVSLTVSDDERTALVSVTTDSARLYANARLLELDLRSGQFTDRGKGVLARRLQDGRMLVVQSSGEAFVTSGSGTPTGISLGRVATSANSGQVYPQISIADDGTLLFVAGVIGRSRLTWLDVNGNVVGRRNTEGNMWGIALSPDGSRVAYSDRADERTEGARSFGLAAVWVEDLRSGARTRLADADMNVRPSWSPDGQSVLWTRVGLGTGGFFERRADASAPERRVVSRELFRRSQGDARWHPDHRTLLLRTFAQPSVDIFAVIPAGPDSSVRPVAATAASESSPTPSPDGTLLAYNSDESGTTEVYVQPWPSGQGRLQISRGGSSPPRWSHDGRKLYYWNERQNLVVVTLVTRPRLSIASVSETAADATPDFGSANTNVLFDVAPDGRILVAEPVTNSYQLILVRNGLRPTDAGKAR